MKKLLATVLSLAMVLSLAACGSSAPAPAPAPAAEKSETAAVSEKSEVKEEVALEINEEETEDESEDTKAMPSASELPKIKDVTNEMEFELVGCDFTNPPVGDEDVIRLYFNLTNTSEYTQCPDMIYIFNIEVYQNDEELEGVITSYADFVHTVSDKNILPGVSLQFSTGWELIDKSPVTIDIYTDEDSYSFEIDPKTFKPVVPEPVEIKPITDKDWFDPIDEDYFDDLTEVSSKIISAEVVKGTDWMNSVECDVIRVVYEVENESDEKQYASGSFKPMQDGIQLPLGLPKEANDKDVKIHTELQPGEKKQIAISYMLYNSTSPVFVMLDDFGDQYGKVFDIK